MREEALLQASHMLHTNGLDTGLDCSNASMFSEQVPLHPGVCFKTAVHLSNPSLELGGAKSFEISGSTQEQDQHYAQEVCLEEPGLKDSLDSSELMLQETIGCGSQGEVYKAIWWRRFANSTSGITVAVKRLHSDKSQKVQTCEALTDSVSHPNLVECFGLTANAPYLIVSEYCSGGSLYELLHETSQELTWCQRMTILLDIAQGMEHLHSLVPIILHRDLKSCNVLLSRRVTSTSQVPCAKLTDFGLCRQLKLSQASPGSVMTNCVGTFRWMAPEVFSETTYGERIDVFSFGIMMFELLAREIPYVDKFPVTGTMSPKFGLHVCSGNRPNANYVQSGCPSKALELMQVCWAAIPQDRPDFPTVRMILQEILEELQSLDALTHGVGTEVIGTASL